MSDTRDPSMETDEMRDAAEEAPPADAATEATAAEDADGAETTPAGDPDADSAALDARLEAILFSSDLPLPARRLASLLGAASRDVLEGVDRLNVFYAETSRAFRISPLAGGFQLVTTPEHAELLGVLHKERVPTRLSRAALETLSIIAFKQPVTRGEIDAIRGVSASDRVLRHLIERKLVRIAGRAEAPGRPLLYGTTREFLGYFGLSAVSDLPRTDELEALLAGDVAAAAGDDEELAGVFATEDAGDEESGPVPAAEAGAVEAGVANAPEGPADRWDVDDDDETGSWEDQDARGDDDEAMMEEAEEDVLAEELLEESETADVESHSGEESDDREGIRSPQ